MNILDFLDDVFLTLHPYTRVKGPSHDWGQPLFAIVHQLNDLPPSRTRDSDSSDPDDQRGKRRQDLLTCLIYVDHGSS